MNFSVISCSFNVDKSIFFIGFDEEQVIGKGDIQEPGGDSKLR